MDVFIFDNQLKGKAGRNGLVTKFTDKEQQRVDTVKLSGCLQTNLSKCFTAFNDVNERCITTVTLIL